MFECCHKLSQQCIKLHSILSFKKSFLSALPSLLFIIFRYFTVYPKSSDDDRLLSDVLKMFHLLITDSYPVPPENFLGWLAHVIMTPDSATSSLLHVRKEPGDSPQSESKR